MSARERFDEAQERLLIAAIRLAIVRWDLRDEEGNDISAEEAEHLATDTAWACQGEGTCDESPIPEWDATWQAREAECEGLREALRDLLEYFTDCDFDETPRLKKLCNRAESALSGKREEK